MYVIMYVWMDVIMYVRVIIDLSNLGKFTM